MGRWWSLPLLLVACAAEPPAAPPSEAPATTAAAVAATAPANGDDPCAPMVFGRTRRAAPPDLARAWLGECGRAEAIRLTRTLVAFPTVSAEQSAADGPAFVAMRNFLEEWSKQNGLELEVYGKNDAWIVGYGPATPSVGFVMHADVVPVKEEGQPEAPGLPPGWTVPPFEVTEKEGRLYGRGTEDDKGPIASALVVLKALKAFGYAPQGRLQVMMGTGEEHDWDGMIAYAKQATHPRAVISVDAEFPVVVGESGFVAWKLSWPLAPKGPVKKKACVRADAVKAGQFLTQVPGEAELSFSRVNAKLLEAARVKEEPKRPGFRYDVKAHGEAAVLSVEGAAVHSSVAEDGKNALWALAGAAGNLELCPGGIHDALKVVREVFDGDHYGVKLGLAYEHPQMGKLLVVPTVLRIEGENVVLSVNMRRPEGPSSEAFGLQLDQARTRVQKLTPSATEIAADRYVGKPHLADTRGPLTATLLEIYRAASGDAAAQAETIRGGTYARLFPGAVSFGPALPKSPYRGHAPDEYLELSALDLMLKTQLEAVLALDVAPEAASTIKN